MVTGPRLGLRQSQSLVMTPQLQQAIRLLQMSASELIEFVDQELEANPLLERDESGGEGSLNEAMGNTDDRSEEVLSVVDPVDEQSEASMDIDDGLTENDPGYDTMGDALGSTTGGDLPFLGGGNFGDILPNLEQTLSEAEDLRRHLEGQMNMTAMVPADRLIGKALIDSLDDSGYMSADLGALADQLGTGIEDIEAVLVVLQGFDPAGIFARDLKECLALQLRDRDRYDPAMEALIEHLDHLAKRDFNGLKVLCGVDTEDLREMIAEVKALDPKPGLRFEISVSQTVIPDVIMTPIPDGGWRVELNAETLPRVLVNNQYYAELTAPGGSKEQKYFVAEKFQTATWLVRALEQRATTILKASTALVGKQDAFFRKGVQYLKPLILRDIAELTGLHESTISRVTTNKFMSTPRGIYELKYFFSQGVARTDGGEATSAEAVRHRIRQLIDDESVDAILSDDRIAELLRKYGTMVARRTVAKYREKLKIPSSVQRRRQKNSTL